MLSLLSLVAAIIIGITLTRALCSGFERREKRIVNIGFVAQLVGVLAIIGITKYYYGYGDMLGYHKNGSFIAEHWGNNLGDMAPSVLALLFQQGGDELVLYGAGSSTGSMIALSTILSLLTNSSLLAMCSIVAVGGFTSRLLVYRVLRAELAEQHRPAVLWATLLMPSVVFWSGGLLKEAVAMVGIGPLLWGARETFLGKRRFAGLAAVAFGVTVCGLFKGYLLPPFVLGFAAWFYVQRANRTGRNVFAKPSRLILAVVVAFGFLILIGNLFPRYDFRKFEEQVLEEQARGAKVEGGSDFTLGGRSSSTFSMAMKAPWAITTALLRPAIFEARNPLSLVNGLETLVLSILLIQAFMRWGPGAILSSIKRSSMLSFCAVFTLVLALGVGFSTTNMGTLSRYRMPLVPFFVLLLVVVRAPSRHTKQQTLIRKRSSHSSPRTNDAPLSKSYARNHRSTNA